jgi:hypothetical protein
VLAATGASAGAAYADEISGNGKPRAGSSTRRSGVPTLYWQPPERGQWNGYRLSR